jgi:dTDP-4-dehydrorhamnose 3,5-epimerase
MIFEDTCLEGVRVIRLEQHNDERGFFARSFCRHEFEQRALPGEFPQSSIAFNHAKGALRGMHFAAPPSVECKLIRCTAGRVFDVLADLRPDSPTYLEHFTIELSGSNRITLFAPAGIAHGYLTLDDNTEMLYSMSGYYQPELDRGIRWDDPALAIEWPEPARIISDRDRNLPSYNKKIYEHFWRRNPLSGG